MKFSLVMYTTIKNNRIEHFVVKYYIVSDKLINCSFRREAF